MADAGRVITGSAKGTRLVAPGAGTRPLSDRVKQALFASLEADLDDGWSGPFLDLFSGSGAGGIEALSRGAPLAVFVERDPDAARVIGENLSRARLKGGTVIRRNALTVLEAGGAAAGGPFVAAIVDPPYADVRLLASALGRLGEPSLGWLAPGAIVVAKHFWRDEPPEAAGDLRLERRRRFGETALSYYRRAP